jgi:hypothetical protein
MTELYRFGTHHKGERIEELLMAGEPGHNAAHDRLFVDAVQCIAQAFGPPDRS